jgi:hypothetical protein
MRLQIEFCDQFRSDSLQAPARTRSIRPANVPSAERRAEPRRCTVSVHPEAKQVGQAQSDSAPGHEELGNPCETAIRDASSKQPRFPESRGSRHQNRVTATLQHGFKLELSATPGHRSVPQTPVQSGFRGDPSSPVPDTADTVHPERFQVGEGHTALRLRTGNGLEGVSATACARCR